MKATVFKCDGCGIEKKESNHWYMLDVTSKQAASIRLWEEDVADYARFKHFCGTECLFKRLAQWAQ